MTVLFAQGLSIKIKQGNKEAFVELYKLYYKPLCKYAFNLVKNLDVAEEMVQDVIFKIWERRETLNIPDYLKEYLFKSVFNNCMNYIKEKYNDEAHLKELSLLYQTNENEFKDFIILKEMEDKIMQAIESLPERSRSIFKMNRFDGLTFAEIATKINITAKGVEYHMSIALRQLSSDLKEYLPLLIFLTFINF